LERTRELLETGRFHGIGEVHLIAGFISNWQAPVIDGLFRLAAEFDVPVLVHTEFSRANYLMELCAAHPDTRMLWAHAGAILPPTEVKRVIDSCPNVWVELSARDPWRFVAKPISDDSGHLLPDWRELVLAYPDRFMVGSDPVWPVEQLDGWDQPDTGWQEPGVPPDLDRRSATGGGRAHTPDQRPGALSHRRPLTCNRGEPTPQGRIGKRASSPLFAPNKA
jgi:predicted TIM-barrel fold metal-dependent hydrolase